MAKKMVKASIEINQEDDRDYYGKKRLEKEGVSLCSHFHKLYRNFTDVRIKILKRKIDDGQDKILFPESYQARYDIK
jgi:hypothetical protein